MEPIYTNNEIYDYHTSRLNIKDDSKLREFTKFVYETESSSNPTAKNNTTSAAGGFQFVKDSVLPALNRMETTGYFPEWASELRDLYKDGVTKKQHQNLITSLGYEQQEALFLGDIMGKTIHTPGYGDFLLEEISKGNVKAMKDLYKRGHHTSPDKATLDRIEKIFGRSK